MNIDVNYNDELDRKNIPPKLLPQEAEIMSNETVELLTKSRVTRASRKARNGNPTVVSTNKQVTWLVPLTRHTKSVLSDDMIARLKKRIERSRKARPDNLNVGITKRAQGAAVQASHCIVSSPSVWY